MSFAVLRAPLRSQPVNIESILRGAFDERLPVGFQNIHVRGFCFVLETPLSRQKDLLHAGPAFCRLDRAYKTVGFGFHVADRTEMRWIDR